MMPEGHGACTDQAKQSLHPDQGALGRDVEICIKCQRLFSQSHILTIFVLTVGCLEKGSRQKIKMATPPNPLDNHIDEVQTHKTV